MPLLTPPQGSSLTAEQLAAAEQLVAAHLGVTGLEREEGVGESGEIGSSGLIGLTRPAVAIQSLTVAGAPAAGILRGLWTVDVSSVVRPYLTGGAWGSVYARLPYAVVYTAGWTAEDLPGALRQAILSTATGLAAAQNRVGIKSESMGPVSRTYTEPGTISADVLALMKPYLPLRF